MQLKLWGLLWLFLNIDFATTWIVAIDIAVMVEYVLDDRLFPVKIHRSSLLIDRTGDLIIQSRAR